MITWYLISLCKPLSAWNGFWHELFLPKQLILFSYEDSEACQRPATFSFIEAKNKILKKFVIHYSHVNKKIIHIKGSQTLSCN